MPPNPEVVRLFFPLKCGLVLGAETHRDGTPVAWEGLGRIPIYAKYYLTDEFETPILDPSACYFNTPSEVVFVADVYQRLLDEKHPCPDRSFHDVYAAYFKLSKQLPEFVRGVFHAKSFKDDAKAMQVMMRVTSDLLDM